MFLGPGGSGKSSLLDGLMNQPLRPDESTALADTLDIKYQWVEAADAAEDAWKAVTEKDEDNELASLSHKVVQHGSQDAAAYIKSWAEDPAVLMFNPVFPAASILDTLQTDQKYAQKAAEVHENVAQNVAGGALLSNSHPEVVMHIWDCGGQPVFLDILSAFITKRTMFLLLFDASRPLSSKYQEIWRHEGKTFQGKELNITILQLMMQWMQLIHASLMAKKEKGTAVKEAKQSETTRDRRQSSVLPKCPRIMIVGSHGDNVPLKEKVLEEIESSCKGRAFHNLVVNELIVNNKTAGKGKMEDPGYKKIRKGIYEFTHSLSMPTPIAWVAFRKVLRKVLQKAVDDSPVLSYEQVVPIAEKCGIPKEVVPSVLHFYHELGVLLHYASIESLSTTIIADPKWLIKQLCKLFMPQWYFHKPPQFWRFLEKKGVLLEPLYQDIWGDCGLRGGAQALADLLEHFNLAKKINSVPTEMQLYEGRKYFVPCMLKARSEEGPVEKPQEAIQKAASLHITFNTGCIPPGFFVRLAARITNSEKCTPIFERGIYRDSITFSFEVVDRVIISESKSLVSVQIDFIRLAKSNIQFSESCLAFRKDLSTACKEALSWLPSIEHDFAFRCSCSEHAKEHFAIISDNTHRGSQVFCLRDKLYKMDQEHHYWMPSAPPTGT